MLVGLEHIFHGWLVKGVRLMDWSWGCCSVAALCFSLEGFQMDRGFKSRGSVSELLYSHGWEMHNLQDSVPFTIASLGSSSATPFFSGFLFSSLLLSLLFLLTVICSSTHFTLPLILTGMRGHCTTLTAQFDKGTKKSIVLFSYCFAFRHLRRCLVGGINLVGIGQVLGGGAMGE